MVSTEVLRKFSFFEGMDESLLQEFAANVQEKHYKAGQLICGKDDMGCEIFFVVRGKLSVVLRLLRFDSRFKVISEIEEGNFFGEISFFDSQKRSADVRAQEDVDLLVLTPWAYSKIIDNNFEEGCRVQGKIITRMVKILRDMNETYSATRFKVSH